MRHRVPAPLAHIPARSHRTGALSWTGFIPKCTTGRAAGPNVQTAKPGPVGETALRLDECQKVRVYLGKFSRTHAVRCSRVDLKRSILDNLHGLSTGVIEWHDLVVVPLQNQRRHIDLFKVGRVVDFRELLDALIEAPPARTRPPPLAPPSRSAGCIHKTAEPDS
jgi:hypothetical protein